MVVAKTATAQTDLVRSCSRAACPRQYLALAVATSRAARRSTRRSAATRRTHAHGRGGARQARAHARRGAGTAWHRHADLLPARDRTYAPDPRAPRSIGHPLVGDPVYGGGRSAKLPPLLAAFPRQALHAQRLALVHPVDRQGVRVGLAVAGRLRGAAAAARRAHRGGAVSGEPRRAIAQRASTGSSPIGTSRPRYRGSSPPETAARGSAGSAAANRSGPSASERVDAAARAAILASRGFVARSCRPRRCGSSRCTAGRRGDRRAHARRVARGAARGGCRGDAPARGTAVGSGRRLPAGALRRRDGRGRRCRARGLARACRRRPRGDRRRDGRAGGRDRRVDRSRHRARVPSR